MEGKNKKPHRVSRLALRMALGILAAAVLAVGALGLQPPRNPRGAYGIRERSSLYLPMRDGTRLALRLSLPPKLQKGEKAPAVMEMTRYITKYRRKFLYNLAINLGLASSDKLVLTRFLDAGYAYVAVDARGSGASFGQRPMECSREEIEDEREVAAWIAAQPWSNGKVAGYGVSYSANTAELVATAAASPLAAALPLYPDYDVLGQNAAPGGIANKEIAAWSSGNIREDSGAPMGNPLIDGVEPVDGDRGARLLKEAQVGHRTIDLGHALDRITYVDELVAKGYRGIDLSPFARRDPAAPTELPLYVRVGWMDAATVDGALQRFLDYPNPQTLVIGPWSHAGWHSYDPYIPGQGDIASLDKAQSEDMIAFLDPIMKAKGAGKGAAAETAKPRKLIRYYTFGEGVWKTTTTWPLPGFEPRTYYLGPEGSLSAEPRGAGSDRYAVDFGASTGTANRWHTNYGGGAIDYPDRSAEDRRILAYTSEPLGRDLEITGSPSVTIKIRSSASDGAFFAYLEDLAPDGRVSYLTEGELRALHRRVSTPPAGRATLGPYHSMTAADGQSLVPGEAAELRISLIATSVLLKAGHRVRLAIACADADTFARLPAEGQVEVELLRGPGASRLELPCAER